MKDIGIETFFRLDARLHTLLKTFNNNKNVRISTIHEREQGTTKMYGIKKFASKGQ